MSLYHTEIEVARVKLDQVYFQLLDSENIVPGDIIVITNQMRLPCDAILIAGEVLVDEAVLTGESIPVPKSAVIDRN